MKSVQTRLLGGITAIGLAVAGITWAVPASAVLLSSDYGSIGTIGSGIDLAGGTGTRPGNIYVSDGTSGNALAITPQALGLLPGTAGSGGQQYGSSIDALYVGPPRAVGGTALFSVDYNNCGNCQGGVSGGVAGSGLDDSSGTGTRPANIYASTGNGTNFTVYHGPGLGLESGGDNLDAFDTGTLPTSTDFAPTSFTPLAFPIYFSVDFEAQGVAGSAVDSASGTGLKPTNIYGSYGDGTNFLYMSGADLGFVDHTDSNLDALFIGDDGYVYFSADRGATGVSGSALDDASGLGLKAANIYRSSGNGTNELYLSADLLGIVPQTGADIDALTFVPTPVPEPGTLALFGIGLAALGLARRRKVAA